MKELDEETTKIVDGLIDDLENSFQELLSKVDKYAVDVGEITVKDMDETFKQVKNAAKGLNKYSKQYRKDMENDDE